MENNMALQVLKKELIAVNKLIYETMELRQEAEDLLKKQKVIRYDIIRDIVAIEKENLAELYADKNLSHDEFMQLLFARVRPYFTFAERRDFEMTGRVGESESDGWEG